MGNASFCQLCGTQLPPSASSIDEIRNSMPTDFTPQPAILPPDPATLQEETSLVSIVYASSAASLFSPDDLSVMLNHIREKNTRLKISGMLLYKDGNFLQALEGPDDAVQDVFKTICADNRHKGLLLLLEEQIEQRRFADWSMAFHNLSDPSLQDVPGYSTFMNGQLDPEMFRVKPNKAQRLIEIFRQNM